MKIYKTIEIEVDNEDSDDGFFSVGFVFNYEPSVVPHNIGLCRDAIEEPTKIYIEADDQIHGFYTSNARFSLKDSILTLELLDENCFYWDQSKAIAIELPSERLETINQCMASIFSI